VTSGNRKAFGSLLFQNSLERIGLSGEGSPSPFSYPKIPPSFNGGFFIPPANLSHGKIFDHRISASQSGKLGKIFPILQISAFFSKKVLTPCGNSI
jgi:hypothetical protein